MEALEQVRAASDREIAVPAARVTEQILDQRVGARLALVQRAGAEFAKRGLHDLGPAPSEGSDRAAQEAFGVSVESDAQHRQLLLL
jgi:hypothetical protein